MKITVKVLLGMLILAVVALVFSNFILKKEFAKIDKSDFYWNYDIISKQHFNHIRIVGAENAIVAIEQSDSFAIKVFNRLNEIRDIKLKTYFQDDTLVVDLTGSKNLRSYRSFFTPVRIFTPRLYSISGSNAQVEFIKMSQPNLMLTMNGKSHVTYETNLLHFENVIIHALDSTSVVFGTNPEIKADGIFSMDNLAAKITGYSSLQMDRCRVDTVRYEVEDSASIFLSGNTLSRMKQP